MPFQVNLAIASLVRLVERSGLELLEHLLF